MTARTLRNAGDLIAALPALLGESPHDAVIVLGTASDGEVVAAVKVDRIELCVPELSPDIAGAVAHDLALSGVVRAIVVSWSDWEPGDGCAALDEMMPRLDAEGIEAHAWVTNGSHYWPGVCLDEACCPGGERSEPPIAAVPRTAPVTTGPWHSGNVYRQAADVSRNEKRRAHRAADRSAMKREGDRDAWCVRAWRDVLATITGEPEPPMWGRCIAAVQDVRVRDAVVVTWIGGGTDVVRDVLEGRASSGVHAVMEGALRPGSATLPEASVCDAALEWSSTAVAYARRSERAALLALRAVVLWWRDDLAGARRAAMCSLECDDGYTLAMLLVEMCDRRLRPGWRQGDRSAPLETWS